ncbi:hypothetical protein OBJ68_04155 [Empedobacter falsenii]
MKKIIVTIALFFGVMLFAQLGIGLPSNQAATESLEVNGAFKLFPNNKLFLENPGVYTGTSGNSILLVKNTDTKTLNKFDPANMPFSSVTFVPYHFDDVNAHGLHNYDTKIDATKFYVSIGGFFVLTKDGGTSIEVTGEKNIFPLYSARAFVEGGTWRLQFDLNNNRTFSDQVDIYLNVSIYYKNFLTRTNNLMVVSLGGGETGSATMPTGAIQ